MVKADTIDRRYQALPARWTSNTSFPDARTTFTGDTFRPESAARRMAMYSPFTTLYVSELLENFAMNLRAFA
uniref:Uncharacterized protein n=1 Tax=Rhizobium leguminosarum bv. trifolii TaxID=386 RepID=A0A1C9HNT7_RHILT|nr:hypothetical protein [Rhizobium leguminosarum bv. trifolii]